MSIKKLIALLILPIFLILSGCNDVEESVLPEDEEIDLEAINEVFGEMAEDKAGTRGSCNVVAEKSSCIDYVGSLWTEEQMQLNCQDVGAWSSNTCPYSEIGGCRVGVDLISEMIAWSYSTGGQPISAEEAKYAAGACNATPIGKWILPADLLTNP